ncbi:MAG: TM0996/MTH895 family glutaredoxin-like protein [Anaerolineales bacterium]|nr:TM0996/MTH895 family glutaredoxin-like protein [Anaerolineales bacterium]
MIVKILGGGCANCKKLLANTQEAVKELNLEASIEEVKDIDTIINYGVMKTPALVIDEKVKSSGRVLGVEDIKKLLLP